MFERYTEKARRVIFFARYEASEFGNPYIGPEFLLLGMLREDKDVVSRWLGEGDWLAAFREEVEKYVTKERKLSTSVDLPLTNEAKRILAYAAEEAERLKHQHIGTEHLFLGILRESDSYAAKMLISRGVQIDEVRQTLTREAAQSGFGTGSGRTGAVVQGRSFYVQMILEESGKPLPVLWGARVPAVGEVITVENDENESESNVYQVRKVEWIVTADLVGAHSLAKALVHVRKLKASND